MTPKNDSKIFIKIKINQKSMSLKNPGLQNSLKKTAFKLFTTPKVNKTS